MGLQKYIVGAFSLCIAVACFWMSIKMLVLYFQVKNWPLVEAVIISKKVIKRDTYSTSRTVAYAPLIEYRYQFNEVEHIGNVVDFEELRKGKVGYRKERAEKLIAKMEKNVKVFVNPANPSESAMFCEGAGIYFLVFGIGLFCLLITAYNVFKIVKWVG